jgi:hypothetical protein
MGLHADGIRVLHFPDGGAMSQDWSVAVVG